LFGFEKQSMLERLLSVDSDANSEQCSNVSAYTFTDSGKDTLSSLYFARVSALCFSKRGKWNTCAFLGIVLCPRLFFVIDAFLRTDINVSIRRHVLNHECFVYVRNSEVMCVSVTNISTVDRRFLLQFPHQLQRRFPHW